MKKIIATTAALLTPIAVFAQQMQPIRNANDAILKFDSFLSVAVWIMVSLAVVFIVYNGLMFVIKAGSDDRKTYQQAIMWGIVGLAVILSIWGLVAIVRNTFTTDDAAGRANGQNSIRNLIL